MSNITSIIVSHNARLRCIITKLFNKSDFSGNDTKKRQFKEYRWQNCCVLKLLLVPNENEYAFTLSLVHPGEIDPMETKPYGYWSNINRYDDLRLNVKSCIGALCSNKKAVAPEDNRRYFYLFEKLTGNVSLGDLADIAGSNNLKPSNQFTFYLVRHGQAQHNISGKHNVTDTSLTEVGKIGAKNAGTALNEELKTTEDKLRYYFASDLIRTRQTFEGILSGLESSRLYLDTDKINLVVLPCAHELPFRSDGNCDSTTNLKANVSMLGSDENKMSCYNLDNYPSDSSQNSLCASFSCKNAEGVELLVKVDWSIYSEFYDKSYRGDMKKKFFSMKRQCRKTSMIEESIRYIKLNDVDLVIGGKRRTRKVCKYERKTRKQRRMQRRMQRRRSTRR